MVTTTELLSHNGYYIPSFAQVRCLHMGENFKYMFGLDLAENELSGEIPVELGGLLELRALNLSHNKLSGVIPESFSGIKDVERLDLSFNKLHPTTTNRFHEPPSCLQCIIQ
ncbi:unnamed protein product [Arabis nemorensis]|uniref:Leucine-rich repeat-containing N-terminal plant-type domain-containing protein n=1 Tax=Arabis nemorensis TaxID=586526 RepID=A0A565AYB3_9BRAS|nr:unnamed protein product [Arabis nemorensis]